MPPSLSPSSSLLDMLHTCTHTHADLDMPAASRLHIDPELPFEGSSAYEGKDDAVRRRRVGLKQQHVQSLVCVCVSVCVCMCIHTHTHT